MSFPRWVRPLLLFLAILPAILALVLILRFGTNMPYWDQWFPGIAGIYTKPSVTFADFFAQHNEHRILIPRIVYYILARLSHWNTIVEMVAGWVFVLLTSLAFWRLLRWTLNEDKPGVSYAIPLAWLLCNLILFTPAQAENWLWGMGVCNFLPAMFTVLAIDRAAQIPRRFAALPLAAPASASRDWLDIILAIILCSLATFSTGNGIISWLLVMLLIGWSMDLKTFRQRLPMLAAVAGALVVNLGVYFFHFTRPPPRPISPDAAGVWHSIQFFFIFLGNPFAEIFTPASLATSGFFGAILFLLILFCLAWFLYLWRTRARGELTLPLLIWLCVAGYALFAGFASAITRVELGLPQALAPRYVTFSLFLSIALVPLLMLILRDVKNRLVYPRVAVILQRSLAGILLLVQLLTIGPGITLSKTWFYTRQRDKGGLLLFPVVGDMMRISPAPPDFVMAQADALDRLGYIHPPLIRDPRAALLLPNDGGEPFAKGVLIKSWQPDERQLMIVGYAMVPSKHRGADAVFITADNDLGEPIIIAAAQTGAEWPGVIPVFEDPAYQWAGWITTLPLEKLPLYNKITLRAWALDTDKRVACRLDGVTTISR